MHEREREKEHGNVFSDVLSDVLKLPEPQLKEKKTLDDLNTKCAE